MKHELIITFLNDFIFFRCKQVLYSVTLYGETNINGILRLTWGENVWLKFWGENTV